MPKASSEAPEHVKAPLGQSPATLANREFVKPSHWCPKQDIEFDPWCDPDNPKTITYTEVIKASSVVRGVIPETNIVRSKWCKELKMELYHKNEICHRSGSFNERGALYCLLMLTPEQKQAGVVTASTGNWAMALAHQGQKLGVPVTVVIPARTQPYTGERCAECGATVVRHGNDMAEAKRQAFVIAAEKDFSYLNGYDHPHAIAAAGAIGKEILDQLPETDVILVPVGGGGLLAGIAVAAKHIKPEVLIYGVESDKCCSFFKALENEQPYKTAVSRCLAESLAVPTVGFNAFHTARSLIDKMILVDDDWIARAMLHLTEQEKLVVEGAGAVGLAALLAVPQILPELRGKTVVSLLTGGNMDIVTLPHCLERGKAIEGRIIKVTVTLPADGTKEQLQVFSIISNVGCNVLKCYSDRAWIVENDLYTIHLSLIIETLNLEHACRLKRVMERLFPGICDFLEEPFSPLPVCMCFPKKRP
ncbi:L-threonine ammonia-lyase-like [Choristoneura fumiferana]|uniref:L-threonine ammonia-lyase-like n=1 Tax=Choristoneura fumiferana TaxID=7141 RepID=UPI003D15363E